MPLSAKDKLLLWMCSYSDVILCVRTMQDLCSTSTCIPYHTKYMHLCSTSACIRHTRFVHVHIITDSILHMYQASSIGMETLLNSYIECMNTTDSNAVATLTNEALPLRNVWILNFQVWLEGYSNYFPCMRFVGGIKMLEKQPFNEILNYITITHPELHVVVIGTHHQSIIYKLVMTE